MGFKKYLFIYFIPVLIVLAVSGYTIYLINIGVKITTVGFLIGISAYLVTLILPLVLGNFFEKRDKDHKSKQWAFGISIGSAAAIIYVPFISNDPTYFDVLLFWGISVFYFIIALALLVIPKLRRVPKLDPDQMLKDIEDPNFSEKIEEQTGEKVEDGKDDNEETKPSEEETETPKEENIEKSDESKEEAPSEDKKQVEKKPVEKPKKKSKKKKTRSKK